MRILIQVAIALTSLQLGLTQINQELKFLAQSESPLKWTKQLLCSTRYKGF
ncbi:MAG: hypothetical protein ACK40P_09080 [Pseudanabaena sp.]